MKDHLRERILRKLDPLPDERAYEVLDYIEFLESKYGERAAPANVLTRFADTVEDGLRAGRISTTAIAETMGLMNKAMGVLNGVAAAGKSVASDIVTGAREAGRQVSDIARAEGKAPSPAGQQKATSQADGIPAAERAPASTAADSKGTQGKGPAD